MMREPPGVPRMSIPRSSSTKVGDMDSQARQVAPAIIFIDELDSLGRASSAGSMEMAPRPGLEPGTCGLTAPPPEQSIRTNRIIE